MKDPFGVEQDEETYEVRYKEYADIQKAKEREKMSKTSRNLSKRIFITINLNDCTAKVGELAGEQKTLVEFSMTELYYLLDFLLKFKDDIWYDEGGG